MIVVSNSSFAKLSNSAHSLLVIKGIASSNFKFCYPSTFRLIILILNTFKKARGFVLENPPQGNLCSKSDPDICFHNQRQATANTRGYENMYI